mmetsp:Transcript_42221/g.117571  ORF Transcript_42221/g.117571 Transcript_42221/m.117571 type:complete len:164 (+) Transcript_42221:466-957(+)
MLMHSEVRTDSSSSAGTTDRGAHDILALPPFHDVRRPPAGLEHPGERFMPATGACNAEGIWATRWVPNAWGYAQVDVVCAETGATGAGEGMPAACTAGPGFEVVADGVAAVPALLQPPWAAQRAAAAAATATGPGPAGGVVAGPETLLALAGALAPWPWPPAA